MSIKCRDNNVVVVVVCLACTRENVWLFFALFSGFLCLEFCSLLPQKIREKRLRDDDDDDDDVFSNDDDDDEFGYVVLEITHQKTPITAC